MTTPQDKMRHTANWKTGQSIGLIFDQNNHTVGEFRLDSDAKFCVLACNNHDKLVEALNNSVIALCAVKKTTIDSVKLLIVEHAINRAELALAAVEREG